MSDRFRIKIIAQLAEEIVHLSGGAFEQFAYKVMPLIQPGDWSERGTTIDGAPRKATVDTSLDGSAYVGEMSSDAKYFEGKLTKPKKDLKHALDVHPQAKHIWLLSSRMADAGQTVKIDNVVAEFKKLHPTVETVEILDARKIATHLFKHLGKRDLVRDISHYLPGITRLAEEHAFSHDLPSIAGITPRIDEEARIVEALSSSPYVVLQGMSGIGKTALAARVAHLEKGSFDACIWVDAGGIDRVQQLQTVKLSRLGVSHNIASLVREEHVLLVLDDLAFPLKELDEIKFGRSKAIVTAQVASGKQVLPITELGRVEAVSVLTTGVGEACPPQVLERVLEAVGGHALLLRALNQLAVDHGWDAVAACIETDSVGALEDEHNQNIFRRILRRHTDLKFELQFIRWIGLSRFSEDLAEAVSSVLVSKLAKRGFLAATTSGYVRVHDLVHAAICLEVDVEAKNADRMRERVTSFVRSECETDRILLHRLARTHGEFFMRIAGESREPAFLYMAAMNRTGSEMIDLLGDPVPPAAALLPVPNLASMSLELRAVIEVVEALYTLRETSRGKVEARAKLRGDIQAYTLLLSHSGLTADQRTMLEYHRAKMLPRLDEDGETAGRDEAIAIFRAQLAANPTRAAGRNQLAKILPPKESIAECDLVLAQYEADPSSVNWNVVLDSFVLLFKHGGYTPKHHSLLMATIEYAKSLDLSEAIRLVVGVAQRAWFGAPEVLLPMLDALNLTGFVPSKSDVFNMAQIYKYAALEESEPRRATLLAEALRLYEAGPRKYEYHLGHYAQALIANGRYQDAASALDSAPPGRNAYWWQRKAEALSGLAAHDEAISAIDHAISVAPDPSLLPDFQRTRFRVLSAAGKRDVSLLDEAISALPDEHPFRQKLELERDS